MRTLVTYHMHGATEGHDWQSRVNVARRLADVMGWPFAGEYGTGGTHAYPEYFVPQDALILREANSLGIEGPQDLFGGVVPHAFVSTKAITHPLVASDAVAPVGWERAFAWRAGDSVLGGYTTFAPHDARRGASTLLRHGPVRIKCVSGVGGAGQDVALSMDEVDAVLAAIEPCEFERAGVLVEEHLEEDVTFSVGSVQCAGFSIAYCGVQQTTRNAHGHEVYGGSTLDVVRGGFDALLESDLSAERRNAVAIAQAYDEAAFAAYPAAFASRRNYDVLSGRDAKGRDRAGVLEQSWRIGGASGAELVAFAAFKRDPTRKHVRCATVEIYDDACPVPANAFVYYRGIDARAGPITKYAVEFDGHDA